MLLKFDEKNNFQIHMQQNVDGTINQLKLIKKLAHEIDN